MKQLLLFILCINVSIGAIAQDGNIDSTFNPLDIGKGDGPNDNISATTLQDDGKIIIGGNFTSYNGILINRIARINTDGSLDTSFNIGTGFSINYSYINALAIQDDGKIIIGGWFSNFNGISTNSIIRLNSDGSLDTSFNTGSGPNNSIEDIVIQDDGKIIIGGGFTSYNSVSTNRIARLNTDGSLDTSFNVGSGFNYTGSGNSDMPIVIQDDGKIIISGDFTSYNGIDSNYIIRLNTDGSIDTSFNTGTGANNMIIKITLQDDGKVIIGGSFTSYNGISINRIARLNTDGSIDTSFDVGTGADSAIFKINIQNDGKVFIGGYSTSYNGISTTGIVRLNTDGSLDTSFNTSNEVLSGFAEIAIQDDGKVVFGGYSASSFSRYLARLNTDGSLDTSFNFGYGANNFINDIAIQDDGKVIIGGAFTSYNNISSNNIVRLNIDGSLDTGFNYTGVTVSVGNIVIQDDGKIIISGYFYDSNYFYSNYLTRLNTDGSLDTTFNIGTGVTDAIDDIVIQDDGKIIIAGFFSSYNGISARRIARLNPDGSLDTTFNIGTGASGRIFTIGIQDDGKIIIGGYFSDFNGTSTNDLARLNPDGSIDTSFNVGSFSVGPGPNNAIKEISIQYDGKVIIAGFFTGYNGVSINDLARLNTDGSLDTSFNTGSGVNGIREITLQDDGKAIIGGDFTSYNGSPINRIARLNTDGSIDTIFNVGTGANSSVISIGIQDDGKVVVIGNFTSYNNIRKNRIIRLESSNGLSVNDNEINFVNIFPNPAKHAITVNLKKGYQLKKITLYNYLGQLITSTRKTSMDVSKQSPGIYILEVITDLGRATKKVVIK